MLRSMLIGVFTAIAGSFFVAPFLALVYKSPYPVLGYGERTQCHSG
jgi:hypothetical protein